jgi:flagellar assembly protein FliH
MSFSGANYNDALALPISALQYRDIARSPAPDGTDGEAEELAASTGNRRNGTDLTEEELEARIRQERADAVARVEQQLRHDYEQKLKAARSEIATTIQQFEAQRSDYFARVEVEAVQLSLSIAAKILHREAQVDPMLIATLVRMTIEKMHENSSVTARVSTGCGAEWKRYFAAFPNLSHVAVVEDPQVSNHDCALETELGTAHFGIDAQLKEVERGFFDLLALRPVTR